MTVLIVHVLPAYMQLLEACVKNCGKRFHQELGKFRFLNEMIRSISPKVSQCIFACACTYYILYNIVAAK